ncbi:PREDICTED: uncharacterized protein LOC106314682 [Brassica oleracea var. oleracea]|uniref:uncharacterized protein LOC106314682 n=1 Tax=Brassica oleracea var. oleracea TaxID=109376 RepID=UPI0006A6ABCE|nr:PREDICTED: uncharacterized protein LOC106314682 [Brassica oleracea var. oleracea]
MSAKFPPHSLHPEYQETQAPKPNTREDKKSRPDQGKSSDPTIFFELTCYRCKEKEHVVKFCPTKKALIKTEPQSQQHLVMSHKKSNSMSVLTYLYSAQKVENISGNNMEYGEGCETTKVDTSNLNKKNLPDAQPIDKNQSKLLNPYTLQSTNLIYLCVGKRVSRTKLHED